MLVYELLSLRYFVAAVPVDSDNHFFLFLFEVQLTYDVTLVSGVQHRDWTTLCEAGLATSVAAICHPPVLLQYH